MWIVGFAERWRALPGLGTTLWTAGRGQAWPVDNRSTGYPPPPPSPSITPQSCTQTPQLYPHTPCVPLRASLA